MTTTFHDHWRDVPEDEGLSDPVAQRVLAETQTAILPLVPHLDTLVL